MRKNILNNMAMENHRKNPVYQTLVTDLFNAKVIDQDLAERLLGYEVPDYLVLPEEPEIIREEKNTTPANDDKSDNSKSDDGKSDDGKSDDGKDKSDDGKSDDSKSDDDKEKKGFFGFGK